MQKSVKIVGSSETVIRFATLSSKVVGGGRWTQAAAPAIARASVALTTRTAARAGPRLVPSAWVQDRVVDMTGMNLLGFASPSSYQAAERSLRRPRCQGTRARTRPALKKTGRPKAPREGAM